MEKLTNHKFQMPQKRQLYILIPFALFYTAAGMLGQLEKASKLGMLHNLGRGIAWLLCSYCILLGLCMVISAGGHGLKKDNGASAGKRRPGRWHVYVLFTLTCLACYLPYFLMYYPTWLNNDAVWQIEQALGLVPGSNHHPYFHTLLLKYLFLIGYKLSGSYTGGAAFYTFFQVLIMAMVFGFLLYQLYKRGTRPAWLFLALLFYAVLPINGLLTICMGKDEFFTASLVLFAWATVEWNLDGEEAQDIQNGRKISRSYIFRWIMYFVIGLLLCLLRSNGIFIFLGTAFFLLLARKRKGKFPLRTFLCVAAVILCYLVYKGPVLHGLHVEPPDTIEGLTMPTQHILCAYLKGGTLTEEDIAMIDEVVPAEEVGEYYNPWLFDIVKNFIRSEGNQQVIADNKWEYFKLWFRVGLHSPLQYLVAEVRQTAGYWAYDVKDYEYVYGDYYMVDNPFGMTTERKLFSYDAELAMHDFLMWFRDLYNKVWSLGLNTWLMVFGIAYMAYHGRSVLVYVPFIMMLATLLLAAPVYNEFRYAYGLFVALPLLLSYSFRRDTDEKMV